MAHYTYLPWLRQGLGTLISEVDTLDDTAPGRAQLPLRLQLDLDGTSDTTPSVLVKLQGPGDVVGLEPGQVLKTVPSPGARKVEGNYFAHIELSRPDLPWLLTPLSADADGKLRPWMVLIVVEDRPGVQIVAGTDDLPARLEIEDNAGNELPPLADSWAWAHVQVTGRAPTDLNELKTRMAESPHLFLSRLICPRHLADTTSYHACLVPAFAAGVKSRAGYDTRGRTILPTWMGLGAATKTRSPSLSTIRGPSLPD